MSERKKLEILQAVRGIAAIGIVYFHTEYGPWKSANWGVDFFFLLSGFLAMLSTRLGGGAEKVLVFKDYKNMSFVLHNDSCSYCVIPDSSECVPHDDSHNGNNFEKLPVYPVLRFEWKNIPCLQCGMDTHLGNVLLCGF